MADPDPRAEGDDTPTLADPELVSAETETTVDERTFVINGRNDLTACDSPIVPTQDLPDGYRLGKYQIRELLGKGGMGSVYLAFDPMIEREVAIKVLPVDVASHPLALSRFLTEARSTGRLSHPNVVSVFDIADQQGLHYIVMELLTGGSVADKVAGGKSLDWKAACRIVAEAADGLSAAHKAGLVHRDIKPDNLMLTPEGVVKVVDFGLSKLVDATNDTREATTKAGAILGTPQYMSPEQCESVAVDGRSDIYSLGGTLFRLLTGRLPYEEFPALMQVMMAHVSKPIPDPLAHNPDLPESCRTIVQRAMAKAPQDRYQDAAEMAAELKALIYSAPTVDSESVGSGTASQQYRPLQSIAIVEPSRMQALVQQKAFAASGVGHVVVYSSAAAAKTGLATDRPDVLITAMELGDGRGDQLLAEQRTRSGPDRMLVLNSSDATMDDLVKAGHTGPLALVSKKTKPDEILRSVHACTFLNVADGPLTEAIDPTGSRFLIVCDSSRVPDPIAEQVRRMNLLDVQVTTFDSLAAGVVPAGTMDLVIAVRTAGDAEHDTSVYTDLSGRIRIDAQAVAAVQVDGDRVTLRAIRRGGFAALTRCPLDDARLTRLVQVIQK
ncbi:MAG: serine/threonine-protein kinase [Planctomycetaceae bacterium]